MAGAASWVQLLCPVKKSLECVAVTFTYFAKIANSIFRDETDYFPAQKDK